MDSIQNKQESQTLLNQQQFDGQPLAEVCFAKL